MMGQETAIGGKNDKNAIKYSPYFNCIIPAPPDSIEPGRPIDENLNYDFIEIRSTPGNAPKIPAIVKK